MAGIVKEMTLTPGAKLGPYEILAPIGAEGMGEVWKARDTRLDCCLLDDLYLVTGLK